MSIMINLYYTGTNGAARAFVREKYDLHMRAERYVTDQGGVPQGDSAFIRE